MNEPFDNLQLATYVSTIARLKWVTVLLGGLFFVLPEILIGAFRSWVFGSAAAIVMFGFLPSLNYQRHPDSVQALFTMRDTAMSSLGLVLLFGMLEFAYTFEKNFWLYQDYWYVYLGIFSIICIYFAALKQGNYARVLNRQFETLAHYAERGQIDEEAFYDVITLRKGSKEEIASAGFGRYAAMLAPIAAATPLLGIWIGEANLVYGCFLAFLLLTPFYIGIALRSRFYTWKYLSGRDLIIV